MLPEVVQRLKYLPDLTYLTKEINLSYNLVPFILQYPQLLSLHYLKFLDIGMKSCKKDLELVYISRND